MLKKYSAGKRVNSTFAALHARAIVSLMRGRSCLLCEYDCLSIFFGEVSEWLKEHAWKVCILERVSRVRIPPSPQVFIIAPAAYTAGFLCAADGTSSLPAKRAEVILPSLRTMSLCNMLNLLFDFRRPNSFAFHCYLAPAAYKNAGVWRTLE
jgi:hypothetical protein